MNTYQVLVKINQTQSAWIRVQADNDYLAKTLAEAQYGHGSVLSYSLLVN